MSGTHQNIVTELSNFGLIKATGADAETFLHNQFTNDLKLVSDSHSQLSAYCNPKGRILSLFRVFKRDDAYYLCMPKPLLEATLKRLRMFVMMSKVTLEDATSTLSHLGCSGDDIGALLHQQLGQIPAHVDAAVTADEITVIRVPGEAPRFELFGPMNKMQALQQALAAKASRADAAQWALLDIEAGIPSIAAETVEAFVPQMINLQAINALSFKKGCYPGQEIVARMQYLGKLKRRMYLLQSTAERLPKAGDDVFNTERKTGTVVAAQALPEGGCKALIVIEIEAAESGPTRLFAMDGPQLEMLPLPYSLKT